MKIFNWLFAVVLIGGIVALALAPIGPMPGIFASGTETAVPDTWGDTASTLEIELQVGEGPIGRTVIIWTVQVDGDMYVTGQKDSGWVSGIGAGGPVRMQLNGKLYNLNATPVTQDAVRVLTAWQAKYAQHYPDMMDQFPSPEEGARSAVVYKLAKLS